MIKQLVLLLLISTQALGEIRSDIFTWPSKDKFWDSAKSSFKMNQFQIPFYAGILSLALLDGEGSDKVSEENYIFGSPDKADNASDIIGLSLIPLMIYSSFLTDSTVASGEEYEQKASLLGLQGMILLTDFALISALKRGSSRLRPDKSDNESLPSGHSSITAGLSVMIYNNIENSQYKGTSYGRFLQISAVTLSGVVAYARVSALKHHISDVFLGHAFGAFISDFMYKSFLDKRSDVSASFFLNHESQGLQLTYHF